MKIDSLKDVDPRGCKDSEKALGRENSRQQPKSMDVASEKLPELVSLSPCPFLSFQCGKR